jgi:FkbM family methyltransferase
MKKFLTATHLVHEKLGTNYGIGVLPAGFLTSQSVCYCAGAGEDISFDLELIKKYRCKVFIFDPTPRAINHYDELVRRIRSGEKMPIGSPSQSQYYTIGPEDLELCFFYPFGLWSEDKKLKFFQPKSTELISHSLTNLHNTADYIEVDCKKVSSIMSLLGHKKIDLLKLDIVGAEYEVIESILGNKILPDILLIEFDEGSLASAFRSPDPRYFERITHSVLQLKSAGYAFTFLDDWNATFVRESVISSHGK